MDESAIIIKEYSSNPVNNYEMVEYSVNFEEWNNICGDYIKVYLQISPENIIEKFSFVWNTSMVTTAAASILAENIEWKDIAVVLTWDFEFMHQLGLDVTSRRKRAVVLPLMTAQNAIYKFLGEDKKVEFDDLIKEY